MRLVWRRYLRLRSKARLKDVRVVSRCSEALHNRKKRIGDLLAEPLMRDLLYWLLYVCLAVEEYLIRLLLEEG